MQKPQYAILRFAKYKGPEISHIEAHNERTKEKYASNPDVDTSRSHLNYHLVQPERKYRAEAERQIAEARCRTRKDSVRVVEALVTASPEFFKGKKKVEVRAFFEEALRFIEKHQSKETIISAVVHMDEKTPHMHLSFVPLTADKRLSAKDIVGNKKKLTWWQDNFWKHMVRKWPDLERGECASETGRAHIPPRLFKEAAHLNRQRDMILKLLGEVNPLNAKKKSAEIETLLEQYIPGVERMQTQMRKFDSAYKTLRAENAGLKNRWIPAKRASNADWRCPSSFKSWRTYVGWWRIFRRKFYKHVRHMQGRLIKRMPISDEWSGFADLLANLIEKYAADLDIDNMPIPTEKLKGDSN